MNHYQLESFFKYFSLHLTIGLKRQSFEDLDRFLFIDIESQAGLLCSSILGSPSKAIGILFSLES